MDHAVLEKIDALIDACEENLAEDTIRLVNINSELGEPQPGAPFGAGPRKVLDTVLEMGLDAGFYTNDYGVGVISLSLQPGEPDLGIWLHGDVVPAGDGWLFEPYHGVRYQDCIIGRGATDNKGQLSAVFHLLKILKYAGVELRYNPALYVGSNEESGMYDMKGIPGNPDARGFCNVCKPPRLSLVPDSSFPVGYGARGMARFYIKSAEPLLDFSLTAGLHDRPGYAEAVFEGTDLPDILPGCTVEKKDKTVITTYSLPRHTSNPDPNGNMITALASVLLDTDLLCQQDRRILEFIKEISLDIHGKKLGIFVESKCMPSTVVYPKSITLQDGCPVFEICVRYPVEITFDDMLAKIDGFCRQRGFTVSGKSKHKPYLNAADTPVVSALTRIANEITGSNRAPYVSGATYAHYLPNGYTFGMDGNLPPEDFPEGHGGAHGVDECVSVPRLKRAMRIYARALLALNEIEW